MDRLGEREGSFLHRPSASAQPDVQRAENLLHK